VIAERLATRLTTHCKRENPKAGWSEATETKAKRQKTKAQGYTCLQAKPVIFTIF
jgi:hypothetical protein